MPKKDAEILVEPILKKEAVAMPWNPCTLLMVALVASEDTQVTDVVRSCVLLSEKCPVAEYCWVEPINILAETGFISIEASTACVTVSVVDPEKPAEEAVIVVEPALTDVASPFEPDVLLMVATPAFEEFQVTDEETS
jgi:hypothetical protein